MKTFIDVSEYKYGEFKGIEKIYFSSKKEAVNWIKKSISYTNEMIEEEKQAGENLCKYKGRFSFNGVNYSVYLDC